MGTYSEVELRRPPGKVIVPPDAFANTWDERPEEDVCIGLRFIADADLEDARVEAYRRAERLFPKHHRNAEAQANFVASFQDALVRWIVGRGTCDPNNAKQPWELWKDAPEDMPSIALTDHGAQLIFDAWEKMRIAADVGTPTASDEELALLPELLKKLPQLGEVSRDRELRCRRLLRFVLEELESVLEPGGVVASDRSDETEKAPEAPAEEAGAEG